MLKPQEQSNSNNRGYEIYALVDPRDNLVYYVGLSINAENRLKGHLRGSIGSNQERKWLLDLKKVGLVPTLRILEKIESGSEAHALACEKELFWIRELARQGQPLLNVSGLTRPYVPDTPLRQRLGYRAKNVEAPRPLASGENNFPPLLPLVRQAGHLPLSVQNRKILRTSPDCPNLQQLLDNAAITVSELSRRANVDYRTARKAVEGTGSVQRVKALALLRVINELLGTSYRPEDIDGLEVD
jgi:hypothetical protein